MVELYVKLIKAGVYALSENERTNLNQKIIPLSFQKVVRERLEGL